MKNPNLFNEGDICTFQRTNGVWSFFWILKIDMPKDGSSSDRIFSLRKFNVHSQEEILKEHIGDVEELKGLPLQGHFPIVEQRVLECSPRVIGHMPVDENAIKGYAIWKAAFDNNEAGVFTLAMEEI